ncbi:MAG: acyltransferase [Planctomycetes bacterium]|nr:acyltransferase [Planctomycetota bacterium]
MPVDPPAPAAPDPSSGLGYVPQLDGLRALAVGAVLITHFLPGTELTRRVDWGVIGVRLFFVLSGFLITRILLDARAQKDAGALTLGRAFKTFYLRRVLRIFPIYYLTVLVMAAASPTIREQAWVFLLYLQNLKFAWDGAYGVAPHFWTLAVEEQFYLLWPAVVLLAPRRALLGVVLGLILAGPAWRLGVVLLGGSEVTARVFTLGCTDTLGLGALLAVARGREARAWVHPLGWVGAFTLPPLLLAHALAPDVPEADALWVVAGDLALGGCCLAWVARCARAASSERPPLDLRLLANPALVFVGKISYGIYVYHFFVPRQLERLGAKLGWEPGLYALAAASVVVSLALAAASWFALERPLARLKRRLPYAAPRASEPLRPD